MTEPTSRRRSGRPAARECLPMRSADVAVMVAAARRGEEWGWTAIVTRFQPTVHRIARRYRLSANERDDMAQETWLRLFRNIGRIETPAALGGWIATTAGHEALRVLQQHGRELPVEDHEMPEQLTEPELGAALDARDRRDALERALERVSARQRALLRTLMLDPAPTYAQIGTALGMPIGAIGPTRARGLARLRGDAHLARELGAALRPPRLQAAGRHERRHRTTGEGPSS